jgi:hypothetical protein
MDAAVDALTSETTAASVFAVLDIVYGQRTSDKPCVAELMLKALSVDSKTKSIRYAGDVQAETSWMFF